MKTKQTEQKIKQVMRLVKQNGTGIVAACKKVGINYNTYNKYRKTSKRNKVRSNAPFDIVATTATPQTPQSPMAVVICQNPESVAAVLRTWGI